MRFHYTIEHLAFIEEGYKHMHVDDLTNAFNSYFKCNQTPVAIKSCITNNGFRCGRKNRKPNRGNKALLTPKQHQWVVRNYRKLSIKDLAASFNETFPSDRKSVQQLKSYVKNHGIHSGRSGCFEKGIVPWNSGTKGLMTPNSGSFKKGMEPVGTRAMYSERVCSKDGYILIKVPEKNPYTGAPARFKHKHLWLWEQAHGPAPKGHAVIFKDGNKLNCVLENLTCVHRSVLAELNNRLHVSDAPDEVKPTLIAIAQVKSLAMRRSRSQDGSNA